MATPKDNIKQTTEELKKFNQEAASIATTLGEIAKSLDANAKAAAEFTGEAASTFTQQAEAAVKLADSLQGYTLNQLKHKSSLNALNNKLEKTESDRARVAARIGLLEERLVTAKGKEADLIKKSLEDLINFEEQIGRSVKHAEGLKKQLLEIDNKVKFFDDLDSFFGKIPGASVVFKEFGKAAQAARDASAEGASAFDARVAGVKQLGGVLSKGASALFFGTAVKAVTDIDQKTVSLARNLNVGKDQAIDLAKAANDAASNIAGVTGKDIVDAQLSFAKSLGTTASLSAETAANFATLQHRLGLSVEQATEFTKLNIALGKNSKEQTEAIIAQTEVSNINNKSAIRYQDIISDISTTNKAVLLSSKGNAQELSNAAIEARKFGLNLNKVDAIAGNLLNFEQSISKELEAELLTGKNLNLEKARQAALDGDLATLTAEIAKNVGSAEEFADMNRLQQQAIAEAVGMTREELAASFVEQEALTKLGFTDKNQRREALEEELKKVKVLREQGKFDEARILQKEIEEKFGEDELTRQERNRTLQELQAEASQKMVESMDSLVEVLDPIKAAMETIANNAGTFAAALGGIAALGLVGKFGRLLKIFKGLGGQIGKLKSMFGLGSKTAASNLTKSAGGVVMKNTGKTVYGAAGEAALKAGTGTLAKTGTKQVSKTGAKLGAKLGGKTLLKRIPILGSLVGVGFAVDRALKGDFAGAAMEVGSAGLGLLDLVVPGLGTGLSLAADAGIAARDFKRAGTITPTATPMATGGIVNRATNAIVGEAGPEAVIPLNEFYRKFDELISVVKEGGDVYLDSTKMGRAMAVSSYKLQ
jgi:hypothetical protein